MAEPWGLTYAEAVEAAKSWGIPAKDVETMWAKYQELGALVRAGKVSDEVAKVMFGDFGSRLASRRFGH